jgi:predicted metal-dependent phosphoesterase TrpH
VNKKQVSLLTERPQAWHLNIEEARNLLAEGWATADLFPVLEYNMGRIARINRQALRLAQARRRGIVATTDTHVGGIGRAFTIARMAQAQPNTRRFAKKILKIILEAASRSGIPGSLYFRSQRNLADQVSGLLESMEIAN